MSNLEELDEDVIEKIDEETVSRYSERLQKHGETVDALGWGTRKQQMYRFEQFLDFGTFTGKSVMDVGCGFADFYEYLNKQDVEISEYIGVDINGKLIQRAEKNYPDIDFYVGNPLLMDKPASCDVIVMSGALNYRLDQIHNLTYAREFVRRLFEWTNDAILVDMLSAHRTPEYPKEEFVFYYEPEEMFTFATELTPNVSLKHDYKPIPQKEFILKLRKNT